jgi:predicted ferric reductase
MDTDKPIKLNPGFTLSLLVIAIPSVAWMFNYDFSGLSHAEVAFTAVMKVGAFGGMAMFAWSLILSGRYKIFDTLFRGLDKVYVAHRFFGTASIALLLLHPLGYTLLYLASSGANDLIYHFFGFKNIAFTLGRLSLYGLLLMGLWSIFTKAKHETFILIHRWLGLLFMVGALHAFLSSSSSVLATDRFMYWYMAGLTLVAMATFIHYSLLSDFLHKHYSYTITSIRSLPGDVWELKLRAKYRILRFRPGQFAYLSFDSLPEKSYHPFTIASGDRASELTFYIKELGDLTGRFSQLNPHDLVKVKGPYGGFTFDDKRFNKQLWIAGGIGVTPFLSAARSLEYANRATEIEMLYFVKDKTEAFGYDEFYDIEEKLKAFNVTLVEETEFGQKSLHDIADHFNGLDDCAIYLCGPPGMIKAYSEQVRELGLEDQLYFEEFDY